MMKTLITMEIETQICGGVREGPALGSEGSAKLRMNRMRPGD